MNDFMNIKVKLPNFPDTVLPAVKRAMKVNMAQAERTAKKDYLTGPRPGKLGVRSGRLRNSIRTEVNVKSHRVEGRIGTNVKYAPIHEFGGEIKAKGGGYLKFMIGGKFIQTKKVDMPARPFLRPSIEDNLIAFQERILNYIEKDLK